VPTSRFTNMDTTQGNQIKLRYRVLKGLRTLPDEYLHQALGSGPGAMKDLKSAKPSVISQCVITSVRLPEITDGLQEEWENGEFL